MINNGLKDTEQTNPKLIQEIGLEKIIVNTLRRNYCSGWTLSAHICKNDQTCCYGQIHSYSNLTNTFNENDNIHSELENCKYFHVHSNKDEFIIKLTALKELAQLQSDGICHPGNMEIKIYF